MENTVQLNCNCDCYIEWILWFVGHKAPEIFNCIRSGLFLFFAASNTNRTRKKLCERKKFELFVIELTAVFM